jgi:hypothetical protein
LNRLIHLEVTHIFTRTWVALNITSYGTLLIFPLGWLGAWRRISKVIETAENVIISEISPPHVMTVND